MADRERAPQVTLQAESCAGEPCALVHVFGADGGTLGRAEDCDFVLPDPARTISRVQARLIWRGGSFHLIGLGTNPVRVQGKMLGTGEDTPLVEGARIEIGHYVLHCRLTLSQAPAPACTLLEARQAIVDAPSSGTKRTKGVEDLLDIQTPPLHDELGLFGAHAVPRANPAARSSGGFRGSADDHIAPEHLPLSSAGIPTDYDPLADRHASLNASKLDDATLSALLEGMGLPHLRTSLDGPAIARVAGMLLRDLVGGTMGALLARSLTKRESRLDVTVMAQQANNPLKFLPDPETALVQLLTDAQRGFMPARRAVDSAFDDLRLHELATRAACRSAMAAVVEQLGPKHIAERVPKDSAIDRVFQDKRKARYWDILEREHAQWQGDAFQRRFAELFSAAYEKHLNSIDRGRS